MRLFLTTISLVLLMTFIVKAQNTNSNTTAKTTNTNVSTNTSTAATKRPPVFRATKDQVQQAQAKLKEKALYTGNQTGSLDDETRSAIKKFQENEKIRATGTLNRITLEKMGIKLNEKQLLIPVSESSASPATNSGEKAARGPVFRATKDQIMQAQKMLKDKGIYTGEQTGKMEDNFRASLKKYQEAEKIKVTGTLNRETLGKMGIALTDNQKAMASTVTKTN